MDVDMMEADIQETDTIDAQPDQTTTPPADTIPPSTTPALPQEQPTAAKGSEITTVHPIYTPGPDAIDISPNGDGAVTKEIKRSGSGDEGPLHGDRVYVHYVGTLDDGTEFDTSRGKKKKFEFRLGEGDVVKAWDLCVATMKRGELAILQCSPKYGYGAKGKAPKIPPKATLVFEIELFDWKGHDVTEKRDGGVLKSEITKGSDNYSPRDFTSCRVHIVGKYNGRMFENRKVTFVVGEGSEHGIVDGIEVAIVRMNTAEKARLKVKAAYAYGTTGSTKYSIPPDADLDYDVELKSFQQAVEPYQLQAVEDKLNEAERLKNVGTEHFKASRYRIAARYYNRMFEFLKDKDEKKTFGKEFRKQMITAAHLNLAMCHLKTEDNAKAIAACDEALKVDPNNEKGHFRRATANMNLQNFEEAIRDFEAVLEVDPDNKAAKNQIVIANQKIAARRDREKRQFGGMFNRFAESDFKSEVLSVWKQPPAPPLESIKDPVDIDTMTTPSVGAENIVCTENNLSGDPRSAEVVEPVTEKLPDLPEYVYTMLQQEEMSKSEIISLWK